MQPYSWRAAVRKGELLAIRWGDVDLDGAEIRSRLRSRTVERQLAWFASRRSDPMAVVPLHVLGGDTSGVKRAPAGG